MAISKYAALLGLGATLAAANDGVPSCGETFDSLKEMDVDTFCDTSDWMSHLQIACMGADESVPEWVGQAIGVFQANCQSDCGKEVLKVERTDCEKEDGSDDGSSDASGGEKRRLMDDPTAMCEGMCKEMYTGIMDRHAKKECEGVTTLDVNMDNDMVNVKFVSLEEKFGYFKMICGENGEGPSDCMEAYIQLMKGVCGSDEDHDDQGSDGEHHDDQGSDGEGAAGNGEKRRLSKRRRLEAGATQPADGEFGTTSHGEGGDDGMDGMKMVTDMCHVYGKFMENKEIPGDYAMGPCGNAIYHFMDTCKEGDKLPVDDGEMADVSEVVDNIFKELDCKIANPCMQAYYHLGSQVLGMMKMFPDDQGSGDHDDKGSEGDHDDKGSEGGDHMACADWCANEYNLPDNCAQISQSPPQGFEQCADCCEKYGYHHDDQGSEGDDHGDQGSEGDGSSDDQFRRLQNSDDGSEHHGDDGSEHHGDEGSEHHGDHGSEHHGDQGSESNHEDMAQMIMEFCRMEGDGGALLKAAKEECGTDDMVEMRGMMVSAPDAIEQMISFCSGFGGVPDMGGDDGEKHECSRKVFIKNDPELFKMYPPRFCK